MLRRSLFHAAVGSLALLLAGACAAADEVRLGMSRAKVVDLLGEPSRKAVLDGKVLRSLDQLPAGTDVARSRLVYFYDQSRLQVWFLGDEVTGVTRNGVAVR